MKDNTKIVFMGTPDFAVESLDAICKAGYNVAAVVTVPDRHTGRGLKITQSPVKEYALLHGIPLLQPEKLRDETFQQQLRNIDADIFVVVAFRMLPQSVWSMPRRGTFNLHASLLPQYRGAAPINWAIMNGDSETGVTTFLLNENIDEGRILLQERTPIAPNDTAETLHDRLASMGSSLVVATIEGLLSGSLVGKVQPQRPDLRPAPKIFKDDCVIKWELPGKGIVDMVRGLSPYPCATMKLVDDKGGERAFKVYEVSFIPDSQAMPHALQTDRKTYLKIGVCGGWIAVLSLQISGKKRNSIEEFLRGYDVSEWKLVF